jgi:hypothetical protein
MQRVRSCATSTWARGSIRKALSLERQHGAGAQLLARRQLAQHGLGDHEVEAGIAAFDRWLIR